MAITRDEHIRRCKQRALEYLNRGDCANAITSMLSDLSKHDETRELGNHMAPLGLLYAINQDFRDCRRFIEGFRTDE
jgi:hypothetical protein